MSRLLIRTPSRLHFGLLGWGEHSTRHFGGVGLMIDAPGIELTAEAAASFSAEGPLADRAIRIAERLVEAGAPVAPARIVVRRAPEEHVGLGVGTQLSLAVARLLLALAGQPDLTATSLAKLSGRGMRSGIGLHGFDHGGLIVDGGRRTDDRVPPLLVHLDFPGDWAVLVIMPGRQRGLHGPEEIQAFAELPAIPEEVTDRLCRLVLLGILPAVVERDLPVFGAALADLQRHVGECFAPAQGGTFARPELAAIVKELEAQGVHGAGQSSWGPTLYAFSEEPPEKRAAILQRVRNRFNLSPSAAFWTSASSRGAVME